MNRLSMFWGWNIKWKIQKWFWINITHRPYCLYHGFIGCNENCEHTKLKDKEMILREMNKKLCNSILKFKGTNYFAMCELEEGHKCNHKGGCFEWEEGTIEVPNSERMRAMTLMNFKLNKRLENNFAK